LSYVLAWDGGLNHKITAPATENHYSSDPQPFESLENIARAVFTSPALEILSIRLLYAVFMR